MPARHRAGVKPLRLVSCRKASAVGGQPGNILLCCGCPRLFVVLCMRCDQIAPLEGCVQGANYATETPRTARIIFIGRQDSFCRRSRYVDVSRKWSYPPLRDCLPGTPTASQVSLVSDVDVLYWQSNQLSE